MQGLKESVPVKRYESSSEIFYTSEVYLGGFGTVASLVPTTLSRFFHTIISLPLYFYSGSLLGLTRDPLESTRS